jgi:RecA-family ATPase
MNEAYPEGFATWPQRRRDEYFGAQARDYRERKRARSNGDAGAHEPRTQSPLVTVSPATLHGVPPERQWLALNWIPYSVVTGIYGDGGLGKSLLAQQLQTGTALGATWLGLPVEKCASIGVYCEDSRDELWRRQADINESYGVDFDALSGINWMPRLGHDNLLMTFGRNGVGELTGFHKQVLEAALDFNARLVIVDTASDTFGGNENDRGQVRQFVQRALGSLALAIEGAVVLSAHPSRSGLNSGEGDGGSTGWSNAFRSRLYLREPTLDVGEPRDPNARILERRKANYASRNEELRLNWRRGVIEPEASTEPGTAAFGRSDAAKVFLELVREFEAQGRNLSATQNSPNFAPRVFSRLDRNQRQDCREPDFRKAMETLFASGKIENVDYGRKGDERKKIVATSALEGSSNEF